jgi:uncharacterized Zn-finger protein
MITDKQAKPQTIALTTDDLPAFCPNPAMPVWSNHPKVFLDVTTTGRAVCPYCGTVYTVAEGTKAHSH